MKTFLTILFTISTLFTTFCFAAKQAIDTSTWKIIGTTDGDTLKIEIPAMLPLNYSIRINNIDTPEKDSRAQCPKEAKLAEKASEFTRSLTNNVKTFKISNVKHDKYGGRLLADVEINGIDVAQALIKKGLAREYHGEAKQSWCK